MKFTVLTLFPEVVKSTLEVGVVGQAIRKGKGIVLEYVNPRDFTEDVHRTVDDKPFGGSDGMVMKAEPLGRALDSVNGLNKWVVYLSPQGRVLDHSKVLELSEVHQEIVLLCGRYAGVDQRVVNTYVDEEISIGDYVLSGGELAAAVLIDAVGRQIPGVLGHQESASRDSLAQSGILECPQFTRPRTILGQSAPEILLSGHHAQILEWQEKVALIMTLIKRPDLVSRESVDFERLEIFFQSLSEEERLSLGIAEWKWEKLRM